MEIIEQLVGSLPAPILTLLVAVLIFYFFKHIKKDNDIMKNQIKMVQIECETIIHALEKELQNGFSETIMKKRRELTDKWKNSKT